MNKNPMLAGFARNTINPPLGGSMEGLGVNQPSESRHDDLFVRVLYLSQGGSEMYIVSYDLLFFERQTIDRYKGAIGRVLNVCPSQIFINTTHTHAGPRMTRWSYSGAPEESYLDLLEAATIHTAKAAKARARKVSLRAGETTTDVPVSRRKINNDGKAEWAPFLEGVVYDRVPYCILTGTDGEVVSVMFSVACHPSMIYVPVISAEFPGVAMRILNDHFQTEGSMFFQGAAGDTKPRAGAVGEQRWKHCTWEEMEDTGRQIAELVIGAAADAADVMPELKYELQEVDWPLDAPLSREQYAACAEDESVRDEKRLWARDMMKRLDDVGHLPQAVPISVHFVHLGEGLRMIGIEGEVLARLGLRIAEICGDGVTFVLGYTNGTQIYMPVTEELPEEGYEVDSYWEYHWPAGCAEQCEIPLLEMIREKVGSDVLVGSR